MSSTPAAGGILELALLDDLDQISERYRDRFGASPINLSHWDQSASLKSRLRLRLPREQVASAIDYAFSYTQPERTDVLAALGFDPGQWGALLAHSGSSAIVATAHALARSGRRRIFILGPRYFTVPHVLGALGLQYRTVHCRRTSGGYRLPDDLEQVLDPTDALWITNPIYCASTDYWPEDIGRLRGLADRGNAIVLDECLSEPGRRLSPHFDPHHDLTAIFAPHKSICVNGVKFAALVFPKARQAGFDAWADVWFGCLPLSSVQAIRHFLSNDFTAYAAAFKESCREADLTLKSIVSGFSNLSFDSGADGYLRSVFAPRIRAEAAMEVPFLERAVDASGAIFIGGARNEMDSAAGLSFRLNLAAFDKAAEGALHRLCFFLDVEGEPSDSSSLISSNSPDPKPASRGGA